MNINDPYLAYYRRQQTGGGVTTVYRGAPYQRGHGIGSFLGGLFRTVVPVLKSGASAVGREALRSGLGFLGDIAAGTERPRRAANARLKEFTGTLKRKADEKLERILSGGGVKKKRVQRVTPQSLAKLLRVRTSVIRCTGRKSKGKRVKRKVNSRRKKHPKQRTKRKKTTKRRLTGSKRKRPASVRDIFA